MNERAYTHIHFLHTKVDNNIVIGYGEREVGEIKNWTKETDDGKLKQQAEVVKNYELEEPMTEAELNVWIPRNVHLKAEHEVREVIENLQELYTK
jgi:hypothetical protein